MCKAAYYLGGEAINVDKVSNELPSDGQVQVNISYCGICGTDLHIFHGKMDKRVNIPQIMGHEISGVVAAVGKGVTRVKPGDKVTVMPLDWCGECPACASGYSHVCQNLKFLGIDTQGGFQTYWTVPERTVLPLPSETPLDIAALTEPLAVACHDVRLSEIKPGDYAVILGGGPIGALIALTARQAGAKVLVSEINAYRLNLLRELGFDTINPLESDIESYVKDKTRNAGADVVFEVTARQDGINTAINLTRVRGQIVVVGIFSDPPKIDLFQFFWRELKLRGARVYQKEDFEKAIEIIASNELPLDRIISATYPLNGLEEGLRKMESGGEIMKVLIQGS